MWRDIELLLRDEERCSEVHIRRKMLRGAGRYEEMKGENAQTRIQKSRDEGEDKEECTKNGKKT